MLGLGFFNLNSVNSDTGIRKASLINVGFGSSAVAAQPGITYFSPRRHGDIDPDDATGAGTRGECPINESMKGILTAFAPPNPKSLEEQDRTASDHPTFFWYLSNQQAVPIRFTLIEKIPGKPGGKTLVNKELNSKPTGLMHYTLPSSLPGLATDRDYYWTVSLECNPDRPDSFVILKFWFKRVPLTAEQASQVAAATSEQERARVYAKLGYWYDAVSSLSQAYSTEPNNQSIKDDLKTLLEQGKVQASDLQLLSSQ
jgi:hypothetical protein